MRPLFQNNLSGPAIVATAAFTAENWIFGPASWIYGYGSGLETIPAFLALSRTDSNLSPWASFVAGGVDRLAFWGNADAVSPEFALFALFPVWIANSLHRSLQYLIGIYFTARLLHDHEKLGESWSILGGILFGCFSYFSVGALLTLSGVPLLVWALDSLFQRRSGLAAYALLGLGTSFLTTFTFGVPYLIVFVIAWRLFIRGDTRLESLMRLGVFSLVLIAAESPQAVAVIANAPDSHRANWTIEPIAPTLDGLLYRQLQYDLFAQDKILAFITRDMPLPYLALSFMFVVFFFRRDDHARFFCRITALHVLLSQKWLMIGCQRVLADYVPWVGGVYMGRFFEVPAPFLIALGLTSSLHLFWRYKSWRFVRQLIRAAVVSFVVFMVVEPKRFLFAPLGIGDWGQANYKVAALEHLKSQTSYPFRVASVMPLQPAYAYAQGLEAADGWANIYPRVYRELWLRVLTPLLEEVPSTRQFFGVDSGRAVDNFIFLGTDLTTPGTGRLVDEDPIIALREGFDVNRRFRLDLLRLMNVQFLLSEFPLKGDGLNLVHAPKSWPTWPQSRDPNTGLVNGAIPPPASELAGVSTPLRAWHEHWRAVKKKLAGKDIFIYELSGAVPRLRLVDAVTVRPDGPSTLDAMDALHGDAVVRTVVVEGGQPGLHRLSDTLGKGTVHLEQRAQGLYEATVVIQDGAPGLLVLAETWSRYWQVHVDRIAQQPLRVNHAQIGAIVPSGSHRVVIRYSPPYWPL